MTNEKRKAFTLRISQANRTELVVVTYDILLEELKEGKECYAAGKTDEGRRALKRAQRYLCELMSALDYQYPVAVKLLQLYEYAQRVLVKSDVTGRDEGLESVERVIEGLRKAFHVVAEQDTSGPVMENTQTVYAGLTYGRNSLNETDPDAGKSRGFLA